MEQEKLVDFLKKRLTEVCNEAERQWQISADNVAAYEADVLRREKDALRKDLLRAIGTLGDVGRTHLLPIGAREELARLQEKYAVQVSQTAPPAIVPVQDRIQRLEYALECALQVLNNNRSIHNQLVYNERGECVGKLWALLPGWWAICKEVGLTGEKK